MIVSGVDSGIPVFIDPSSRAESAVVALIDENEFSWAQIVVSGLSDYSDYEEWKESREGFQMGLAMAGVDARLLPIAVTPFLAWCRITGAAPAERALDDFAVKVSLFRSSPEPTVFAVVRKREFEAHSRDVAALSAFGDYERWVRHRRTVRARTVRSGRRVEELPILIGDFIKWSACAGPYSDSSSRSIDRYAQLALEYFSSDLPIASHS
jgi:hypothetical protein